MVLSKKVVFASPMCGLPKEDNFRIESEELAEQSLVDGQILLETICLSVDPYMRIFPAVVPESQPIGTPMLGEVVAKVIASKSQKFKMNDVVLSKCGWRSHCILDDSNTDLRLSPLLKTDLTPSLALGAVGMPGATAYFGVHDILCPAPGETLVVNAAAGAVGSIVGQIGKIKGCSVIGYAGSDEKVKHLVNDLGFDYAFNYKTESLEDTLKLAAPLGIDCYFDNVGGQFSNTVLKNMKDKGRICVCGAISGYNSDTPAQVSDPSTLFIVKQLKMQGMMVYSWPMTDWYDRAFKDIIEWIKEDKIKFRETITKGIESAPAAFISMLTGGNLGKAVVVME